MSIFANAQLRAIVVDDDADSADLLALLLSTMGVQATAVYSGHEALALVDEIAPSIIFIDLDLSARSCHEVTRGLRNRDSVKSTFIIALTREPDPETQWKVLTRGFDMQLRKPVDPNQVWEVLRDLTRPLGICQDH